jgi:dihydroneopterin triphosphate diphosphatase
MDSLMKPEVRTRSRAVSCFALKKVGDETKVLIMKRVGEPMHGQWFQCAGRIEAGETAWQAALRELKEEANLTPRAFYSAEICDQFYSHQADAIMLFPVFVAYIDEADEVTLNEEHSEYKWMSRNEAETHLPFPNQRVILGRIWFDFVENEPTPLLKIEQSSRLSKDL